MAVLKRLVRVTRSDRLLVDTRAAWSVVLALLLVYAAGLFAFYPQTLTNTDEAMYVRQARVYLEGETTFPKIDPFNGEIEQQMPGAYPVGTALFIMPFIWLGGPEAAYVAPCVALALAVLLTAAWLREDRRSPLFALLLLGFPTAIALGRVPLSDLTSTAVVVFGLWLFWRGIERPWPWWLASGFVAGSSVIFREPNVLVFAPFFAGTVLRREWKCWALVVGGLVGILMRPLSAHFAFGDAFFVKQGYVFMPETFMERVPYYAAALLLFVPGGLVGALAYRGRRWPELVACVCFFVLFYLTQKHTGAPSGFARATVIGTRYLLPLIPVVVFGMAESVPRGWRWLLERSAPSRRSTLQLGASAVLALWIAGIGIFSLAVHYGMYRWSASQALIRQAIYREVGDDSVLVTNWHATRKFLRKLERRYLPVTRFALSMADVALLAERHGEFYIAFLDRSDTEYWRRDAEKNAAFIAALELPHELRLDLTVTPTDRLRIWRVYRDDAAPTEAPDDAGTD